MLMMDAPKAIRPRSASPWLWIALIWLSIGTFDASDTVFSMRAEGHHHAWVSLFFTLLFSWLPWALGSPLILWLGRGYPLTSKSVLRWLSHLAVCAGIGFASAALTASLEVWLNPWLLNPPPNSVLSLTVTRFLNHSVSLLILYASIMAIGYALDSRERLAVQETETAHLNELLTRAQLDALRRQIEPHFLFNTLNNVAALIREERNNAAVETIAGLGHLLRRVVECPDRHEVALGEEMEFLEKYLDIQKLRFPERLRLSVDVPKELFAAQVPSLVLQPLVENSIKHGIAKSVQGGRIRIGAVRSGQMLTLNVYNDGPRLPLDQGSPPAGTGISNIQTRLRSLYGNAFSLTMRNEGPHGVEVSISLPFREA
jgi:signal transduction histidine kinase